MKGRTKNTNGSQYSLTPISLAGYRSHQFTSSYGLFAEVPPEGCTSVLQPAGAGNRISAAPIGASDFISPRCIYPGFQVSFWVACYFSQYLLQYFSKRQLEDRCQATEEQFQYLFTLL